VQKFIDGRLVTCLFDDEPAVAFVHAQAFPFGGACSSTDAYPVCDYHLHLFVRTA
jgi:hypothetical protein